MGQRIRMYPNSHWFSPLTLTEIGAWISCVAQQQAQIAPLFLEKQQNKFDCARKTGFLSCFFFRLNFMSLCCRQRFSSQTANMISQPDPRIKSNALRADNFIQLAWFRCIFIFQLHILCRSVVHLYAVRHRWSVLRLCCRQLKKYIKSLRSRKRPNIKIHSDSHHSHTTIYCYSIFTSRLCLSEENDSLYGKQRTRNK